LLLRCAAAATAGEREEDDPALPFAVPGEGLVLLPVVVLCEEEEEEEESFFAGELSCVPTRAWPV